MFTLETRAHVAGLSARAAYDYMIVPPAPSFQAWWPGTHLISKVLRRGVGPTGEPSDVGTVVYLEQMIGPFRVRETAEIVDAVAGRSFTRQIIWNFRWGIRLPIFITFELEDTADGVTITHTMHIGYRGLRRILDPLFRLFFFTRAFAEALDEHLRTEYVLLRDVVKPAAESVATAPQPAARPTMQLPALDLSTLPNSSSVAQS